MSNQKRPQILLHGIGIVYCLLCLIPFMIVLSASLSKPIDLSTYGYGLFPREVDLTAYKTIFRHPEVIMRAYGVTILITVCTVLLGLLFMSCAAYTLSRTNCLFRRPLSFFFFFTMLFSGGLVPSYIWTTQGLHLKNSLLVLIIPSLIHVFHVIMIRTFMQRLPDSLFESAKMDGASEFRICFQIALPLSVPVLSTVAFFNAMDKWNDWSTPLYYIDDKNLYPLQYLLYTIQKNIQVLLSQMELLSSGASSLNPAEMPGENLLMAMAVVAIGPMLVIFPYFQKYFVQGLTVGAVKG
ncbi:MAG: binding-protein-dependent transport system inner rane component [Paenibacillaceae bacterium]|jgi:putative aldouronate transport system permease protein|nr:binding-protein-dependent transport system inner rane component [Paenibacillaceae bacterium]